MTWTEAIRDKAFQAHIAICLIGIIALIGFLPYFFQEILLPKPGAQLNDWVMNSLTPADHSLLIFILIYTGIMLLLIRVSPSPLLLLTGIEAYLILNILRIITLTLVTLEPPQHIIPLTDPFISKVAYGATVFNKDLFFSGHISTLVLLVMIERKTLWRLIFSAITVIVALLILKQHVHYSIDILAAPFAAWGAYYIGKFSTRNLDRTSIQQHVIL